MSTSKFAPKLDAARPRVSAALQQASVDNFTPDDLDKLAKIAKLPKNRATRALLAMTGKM